jgi:molybdopterin adenylyltransferase
MREKSLEITPLGMLSRAVAGLRGQCLIVNLPGSTKAVRECLEAIIPAIPHAIDIIKGAVTEHG